MEPKVILRHMGQKTIIMDQRRLEVMATGSLIGLSMERDGSLPSKVILEFPQTPLGYRVKNGGPEIYLIPEYVIPCMMKDLLNLRELGVEVEIITRES